MKKSVFAGLMDRVFETEINKLREAGQKEYAGGEDSDAFTNFNKLSGELDLDRKKVLWIYAMKHKDGIAAYLRGEISQREPVEGRINDLIVYLFLLRGMVEEDRNLHPIPNGTVLTVSNDRKEVKECLPRPPAYIKDNQDLVCQNCGIPIVYNKVEASWEHLTL